VRGDLAGLPRTRDLAQPRDWKSHDDWGWGETSPRRAGGTFEFRVEPHASGSRIHFSIDRKAKTLMGRLVGALMQVSNGAPMKKSCYAVYGKPT